jgi:hypothetical protein
MTTRRTTDLAGAARAIDELVRRLSDPEEIAQAIASSTASEINAQGARTSSPAQASIVAGAFSAQGDTMHLNSYASAGRGTAGELIWGSEFGSERFTQFGPRHSSGSWVFPTIRTMPKPVVKAGDDAVDELIGDAL